MFVASSFLCIYGPVWEVEDVMHRMLRDGVVV